MSVTAPQQTAVDRVYTRFFGTGLLRKGVVGLSWYVASSLTALLTSGVLIYVITPNQPGKVSDVLLLTLLLGLLSAGLARRQAQMGLLPTLLSVMLIGSIGAWTDLTALAVLGLLIVWRPQPGHLSVPASLAAGQFGVSLLINLNGLNAGVLLIAALPAILIALKLLKRHAAARAWLQQKTAATETMTLTPAITALGVGLTLLHLLRAAP